MNKKIKELYLESLDENQDFCYQEFAELIVKECGVALNPPVQNRNVISRGQAYELIKKHFGVE